MQPRYTYKSPRSAPRGRRLVVFISICALLLLVADIASGGFIRSFARTASGFIYTQSANSVAAVSGSGVFSSRRALARDNAELRKEIASLIGERAAYQTLKSENETLRALVRLAEAESGITAPILSSIRSSAYGTFTIGAGSNDGVKTGDLAMTNEGFVLGTLSEVGKTNSTVTALFAPGRTVDVRIKGAVVQAVGRGGFNAKAEVPREIETVIGDAVVSSETGRPVGVVGASETSSAAAYADVFIRVPVESSQLTFVYVVPGVSTPE